MTERQKCRTYRSKWNRASVKNKPLFILWYKHKDDMVAIWKKNPNNFINDVLLKRKGKCFTKINPKLPFSKHNYQWTDKKYVGERMSLSLGLTSASLARATGYSRERVRQLEQMLKPYEDYRKDNGRIIYKKSAIKFLLEHRERMNNK